MIGLFVVLVLVTISFAINTEPCFETPCDFQNGACFTSGCQRVGVQTICQLTSTSTKQDRTTPSECVAPSEVPGFIDFCSHLLATSLPAGPRAPVDIIHTTTRSTTYTDRTTPDALIQQLSPGETCIGSSVLVSVGVGSFAGGCAITLVVLCCLRMLCRVGTRKDDGCSDSRDVLSMQQTRSQESHSTAQLLQNAFPDPSTTSTLPPPPSHNNTGIENGVAMLESVYTAASESSSRDYQSIKCESDSPYVAHSDCSCDYFVGNIGSRLDRSTDILEPGTSDDYSSLHDHGFQRNGDGDYYPISEGSNKDYTTLTDDMTEGAYNHLTKPRPVSQNATRLSMTSSSNHPNVTFHVNSFNIPQRPHPSSNRGQGVAGPRSSEAMSSPSGNRTIADSVLVHGADNDDMPHEYFILDPVL